MRCHHHRGAKPVERFEQADELERHFGIDVAGRLVRHQHVGPADDRPRDRHALLFPARQGCGAGISAMRQADPFEHVGHRALQIGLAHARNAQGQGDVVEGGKVVDQAEVLKDHAHAAAIGGQPFAGQGDHIGAEHADRPARRPLRKIKQPQQGRLARTACTGEEIEPPGKQREGHVGQNFAVGTVAQSDIVETDDLLLRHAHRAARSIEKKKAPIIVGHSL